MACDSAVSTTRAWFKSVLRIPPPVRVAVPKEIAPGERRVALVPEIVKKLAAGGFDVAVEHGAGEAAAFSDSAYREAGARGGRARRALRRRGGRREGAEAVGRRGRAAAGRLDPDRVPPAADRSGRHRAADAARRHRLRARVDPAHHPRPAHGRALLSGHRVGLQGGAARRRPAAEVLPHADDRRRNGPARPRCS